MSTLALQPPVSDPGAIVTEHPAGPPAWLTSDVPGLSLREAVPDDITACGRILYEAFATLADEHGFPRDFPTVAAATGSMRGLITNPGFFGIVAERGERIVGSSFLDERSTIGAVGPVSVDPAEQDAGVGRALMRSMLARASARGAPGVRLVQISYHNRSICLYTKLGFDVRETFLAMYGPGPGVSLPGYDVRPARPDDLTSCDALCVRVHGHDRSGELAPAIAKGHARVVEHLGRIVGYATGIGYFSHAVAETSDAIEALIGAADAIEPPGIVVPVGDPELIRWCLAHGLRVFFVLNLMSIGIYQEPRGAYLASIGY